MQCSLLCCGVQHYAVFTVVLCCSALCCVYCCAVQHYAVFTVVLCCSALCSVHCCGVLFSVVHSSQWPSDFLCELRWSGVQKSVCAFLCLQGIHVCYPNTIQYSSLPPTRWLWNFCAKLYHDIVECLYIRSEVSCETQMIVSLVSISSTLHVWNNCWFLYNCVCVCAWERERERGTFTWQLNTKNVDDNYLQRKISNIP